MQMLNNTDFLFAAGPRIPNRDMSPYDGKPFKCACGREHLFQSRMDYRNFGSTGANAKIMVNCPQDSSVSTIIETKYKFMVVFDKFISLAGTRAGKSYDSDDSARKKIAVQDRDIELQVISQDMTNRLAQLRRDSKTKVEKTPKMKVDKDVEKAILSLVNKNNHERVAFSNLYYESAQKYAIAQGAVAQNERSSPVDCVGYTSLINGTKYIITIRKEYDGSALIKAEPFDVVIERH